MSASKRLPTMRILWGLALCLSGPLLGCDDDAPADDRIPDALIWADTGPRLDAFDPAIDAAPPTDAFDPVPEDAAPPIDAFDPVPVDAAPPTDAFDPVPEDAAPPAEDAAPRAEFPPTAVRMRTTLGSPSTVAGVANRVSCEALDAQGQPIEAARLRFEVRPAEGWQSAEEDSHQLIGHRAGTYFVHCLAPELGLYDLPPQRWDVLPAAPDQVITILEQTVITAGDHTDVHCSALDAFGNALDASEATVRLAPSGLRAELTERQLRVESAGRHRVSCELPGATTFIDAPLSVSPASPARLLAALSPARAMHPLGSVVSLNARVYDAYENLIPDADLRWSIDPPLSSFGEGRWLAEREGVYTARVWVEGPTVDDLPLDFEATFTVDEGGPQLNCDPALDGQMIQGLRARVIQVSADDQLGVHSVTIDGQRALQLPGGQYGIGVTPHWGLNVHEVVAEDAAGNQNSTFCAWLASDRYQGEASPLNDAVILHMGQRAIDDGAPAQPLQSLADLVRRMLDAPGLRQAVHEGLLSQNPLMPTSCQLSIPLVGGCLFSAGFTYRDLQISGPHSVQLQLINGGLKAVMRLNNMVIKGRTTGTISTNFSMKIAHIEVNATFNVGLVNGQPDVSVRSTGPIQIGALDLTLEGGAGEYLDVLTDLIFGLFENSIKQQIASAVEGFLRTQVDALLSGVFTNLDLDALSSTFVLPSFSGGPPIQLDMGLGFSALHANLNRLKLGFSTRFTGPAGQALPSLGVPLIGNAPGELSPQGSLGAGISVNMINQILHFLWRAGTFELDDLGALLGELPSDTAMSFRLRLPPVAEGLGMDETGAPGVRLHLGPAEIELDYPALFAEPLTLKLALYMRASVVLDDQGQQPGAQIRFEDLEVEQLTLAFDGVEMSDDTRRTLQEDLGGIVQALFGQALNGALPALPVPDFALPEALTPFGIPAGTRLGVKQPSLKTTPTQLVLDGSFGEVQP